MKFDNHNAFLLTLMLAATVTFHVLGSDDSTATRNAHGELAEYDRVASLLQPYLDAARTGDSALLKTFWSQNATVFGAIDDTTVVQTPDEHAEWITHMGASPAHQSRIASIDIVGHAASARIELGNWVSRRFTGFFSLSKSTGTWHATGLAFNSSSAGGNASFAVEAESTSYAELDASSEVLDAYSDAFRTGNGANLRARWLDQARIVGSIAGDSIDRSIDDFCKLISKVGPDQNFRARVVSLERSGPSACARVEISSWVGVRYTDYLLLFKTHDRWRISEKVFDAYTHR